MPLENDSRKQSNLALSEPGIGDGVLGRVAEPVGQQRDCELRKFNERLAENHRFQLYIYGIIGNKSRVGKELGWSDELATDSHDLMIYPVVGLGFSALASEGTKGKSTDWIGVCVFHAKELLNAVGIYTDVDFDDD